MPRSCHSALAQDLLPDIGQAVQRSEAPFAGGTGVSPVSGYIAPFLARKGDGGMVETPVGRRRSGDGAEV